MSGTQQAALTEQQPPPPPPLVEVDESPKSSTMLQLRQALSTAAHHLEQARCQHAELEAWTVLASTLLKIPPGRQQDAVAATPAALPGDNIITNNSGTGNSSLQTGGLQDGWNALMEITAQGLQKNLAQPDVTTSGGGGGQWATTVHRTLQAASVQSMAQLASSISSARLLDGGPALQQAMNTFANIASANNHRNNDPNLWLTLFDERLDDLRTYHAKHSRQVDDNNNGNSALEQPIGSINKRPRLGNPAADGYDLHASVSQHLQPLLNETLFTMSEVLGKYLDLQDLYESSRDWFFVTKEQKHNSVNKASTSYVDFLQVLSSGLDQAWDERTKLHSIRKHYFSFLNKLLTYLKGFLQRTAPLLSIEKQVEEPALQAFDKMWSQVGGYPPAWQAKPVETVLAYDPADSRQDVAATVGDTVDGENTQSHPKQPTIDFSQYNSAADLLQAIDGETLKVELARLGLKCGGTPKARAERLFLLKDTAWKDLPAKVFAKKHTTPTDATGQADNQDATSAAATFSAGGIRRIDLARCETVVMALLNQVQPTLEATLRKSERQLTQTLAEREREYQEELYGSGEVLQEKKKTSGSDEDDEDYEDDAPIYNPKNVPLDWDGKPIPYWLFKLHGLNHYYPCEICGGESYRGRRNFELHFAEQKHAMGMKSLGIPNTKHFHGVTKIEDAQQLWSTLKDKVEQEQFDGTQEEEYEDSHGNVLSRKTYEDLARQGLL